MYCSKHYNGTGPTGPKGPHGPTGPHVIYQIKCLSLSPTGHKEPHGTYFFALPLRTTGLVTKGNNNLIVLKLRSFFVLAR